jgi:DNA-binding transcriptional regulator PaaX
VVGKTRQTARDGRTTRKVQLIRLLNRKAGADVTAISAAFGWQPHTTRAALSGLRKAGYLVFRSTARTDKPARYRISQTSRGKTARAPAKKAAAYAG